LQTDDTAAPVGKHGVQCDEPELNFGFAWNSQGSFNLILGRKGAARIAVVTAKDRIDAS
jgi:hypothetical protein